MYVVSTKADGSAPRASQETHTYVPFSVGCGVVNIDYWNGTDKTLRGLILSQDAFTRKTIFHLCDMLQLQRLLDRQLEEFTPTTLREWISHALVQLQGRDRSERMASTLLRHRFVTVYKPSVSV